MARTSGDDLVRRAQDGLYTAVGLGVLGVQHLQVQRRELAQALDGLRARLDEQLTELDRRVDDRLDETLQSVAPSVPPLARTCAEQVIEGARAARATVRSVVAPRPPAR